MNYFSVSRRPDGGLQLDGFPDAAKFVALTGPKATMLAALSLHDTDLSFAADCLSAIDTAPEGSVLRQALWRSAITHFFKCFGRSVGRLRLNAEEVYELEPSEAMDVFRYFKDLRNKHFVHDENSYSVSLPGAVVANRNQPHKIEKIVCFGAQGETLTLLNFRNLNLLVSKAQVWTKARFDKTCAELTQELESEPYEALLARDAVQFVVPTVADVGRTRRAT